MKAASLRSAEVFCVHKGPTATARSASSATSVRLEAAPYARLGPAVAAPSDSRARA